MILHAKYNVLHLSFSVHLNKIFTFVIPSTVSRHRQARAPPAEGGANERNTGTTF